MYAMFVESEIDQAHWDEALTMLKTGLAPQIQQAPGFVSGTWARAVEGNEARSMAIFETEEAARAVTKHVTESMQPGGPVKIVFAGVFRVVHQV